MAHAKDAIEQRYEALLAVLVEQTERPFVAAEALAAGNGGVSCVARVAGIARSAINRGVAEIKAKRDAGLGRICKRGGGRKSKVSENPKLLLDLKTPVDPQTRHGGAMLRMDAIRCSRWCGHRKICGISCARSLIYVSRCRAPSSLNFCVR